jgi:Acetyltransferase (GNAT) domain
MKRSSIKHSEAGYCQYCYQQISFDELLELDFQSAKHAFYDNNLAWLNETQFYFVKPNEKLVVHCLFNLQEKLQSALLLLTSSKYSTKLIRCLTSFYANSISSIGAANQFDDNLLETLMCRVNDNTKWHVFRFGPVDCDSHLAQAFKKLFPYHYVYSESTNWYIDNIKDFDSFYQQRPSRLKNTIKRQEKKLHKEHECSIQMITEEHGFDQAFADYQEVYIKSWKQQEFSFPFIHAVCRGAMADNRLRMGILYIDGIPAAAQLWFLEGKVASIFKLAYDENYKQYSVGSLLSKAIFEYVISNDQVTEIEYGNGNESYKRDWMTKTRKRVTFDAYNTRTLRGKFLALRKRVKHIIFK